MQLRGYGSATSTPAAHWISLSTRPVDSGSLVRLPFHSFQEDEIYPIGLAIMDVRKAIQSLSHKYTSLGEKQQLMDAASDTTDSSEAEEAPRRSHGPSSSWRRPFTVHLFIFCVQLVLWWGFTMILWRSSRDQLCTAHTSRYWSE